MNMKILPASRRLSAAPTQTHQLQMKFTAGCKRNGPPAAAAFIKPSHPVGREPATR